MSALGSRTAIVSLGCSCQTAWQVNKHAAGLSNLLEEELVIAGLPYDWLIMPPRALLSWLRSGDRFPGSPAEIVQHPNFFWPRHGLHFWHEFTVEGRPALMDRFNATRQKFAHLFVNLHRLHDLERRVFVVSNTQSNLDLVNAVSPGLDFTFTAAIIRELAATVDELIPGNNEFVFVADPTRVTEDVFESGHAVHVLQSGNVDVLGDDGAWAKLLHEVVAPVSRCDQMRTPRSTTATQQEWAA